MYFFSQLKCVEIIMISNAGKPADMLKSVNKPTSNFLQIIWGSIFNTIVNLS